MSQTCAITGASGYVGSRIAAALAATRTIVPISRKPGPEGIFYTLGQPGSIADALRQRQVDLLVHSAWDFSHPKAADNWKTNVEGSRRLLDDVRTAGVQRILFISTISAFTGARSDYGKSKLAVEETVLESGGTVVRPGLVWGDRPGDTSGGMFGSLRQQTAKGGIVPQIGDGRWPQFLVHEDDLASAVASLAASDSARGQRYTLANPRIWMLRDLVLRQAAEQGKSVKLVGVPWQAVHAALKLAETLGLKAPFRSDSLISLVHQDPAPHFATQFPIREYV